MFKTLLQKIKGPDKKIREKPGKEQPSLFRGAATVKDIIAPSVIKDVAPGDKTPLGQTDDYWLEIGATTEAKRYVRNYFSIITGGNTFYGMLNNLYIGEFGEADLDVAVHVTPADPNGITFELEETIGKLEADAVEEGNRARRSNLLKQINELTDRYNSIKCGNEKLFFVTIQPWPHPQIKKPSRDFAARWLKNSPEKVFICGLRTPFNWRH
ncbi:hypothetical protein N752_01040 [Desulforamulus aquiferis]|nr:hypothetical protein N752_01040 [Desulforamulus aquiferis]